MWDKEGLIFIHTTQYFEHIAGKCTVLKISTPKFCINFFCAPSICYVKSIISNIMYEWHHNVMSCVSLIRFIRFFCCCFLHVVHLILSIPSESYVYTSICFQHAFIIWNFACLYHSVLLTWDYYNDSYYDEEG